MVKKIRTMRTFARTASKSMEKQLIENAKKLKKDPYQILPKYDDKYSNKYFSKIKKGIDKVVKFADDESKLEKLSNKRNIEGAIAGTLILVHQKKAPYLAVAKFSTGEITYAQRGKADKEKLIAVQHFEDPVLRLLAIKDLIIKRKLNVYSWDGGYVSTGKDPKPPKEFIDFIIKKIGFKKKNNYVICGDLKVDDVKNRKILDDYYLIIEWKSADIIFALCNKCARNTKNTIFQISKYLICSDLKENFKIEVIGQVLKKEKKEYDTLFIDEYLSGKLSDYDLIEKNHKKREEELIESDEKIFVLDDKSFGQDLDKFIDALDPKDHEREPLRYILEKVEESVILKDVTTNKVLEKYWKDFGKDAIVSIIDDDEMADNFFSLAETPSEILKLVYQYSDRQDILSKLPRYNKLPKIAGFADNIARTYKTFGEKKCLLEISKVSDDTKIKSLAYAFLLVFNKAKDKKWKYSSVEIEYGEFLKDYAKKLLESDSDEYHKSLKDLLTSAGLSEDIDKYKI